VRALPWPPEVGAYDAARNNTYAFDLDKARALLRQAGVDALDMDLIYPAQSGAPVDLGLLAQMYQQDAAKIFERSARARTTPWNCGSAHWAPKAAQ
jgi:ABC-type transport system substrate-binding protein